MPRPDGTLTIREFKAEFPQYNAYPDDQLADIMHRRFYPDVEREVFFRKVGVDVPQPPLPEPSTWDRIAQAWSGKAQEKVSRFDQAEGDVALALDPSSFDVAQPEGPGMFKLNLLRQSFDNYVANWASTSARKAAQRAANADNLARLEVASETANLADQVELSPGTGMVGRLQADLGGRRIQQRIAEGLRPDEYSQEAGRIRRKAVQDTQAYLDYARERIAASEGVRPSEVTGRFLSARGGLLSPFREVGGVGDLFTVVTEGIAMSMPNMIDSLALAGAGVLAGGPIGAAAGAGAGSFGAEYRAALNDALLEEGVDMTDAGSLIGAMEDQALVQRVYDRARGRAAIIGTVDALGFAAGGVLARGVAGPAKTLTGRFFRAYAGQAAAEAPAGGLGEAGAQLFERGEVYQPGAVAMEVLAEAGTSVGSLPFSAPEIFQNAGIDVRNWRMQQLAQADARIQEALEKVLGDQLPQQPIEPPAVEAVGTAVEAVETAAEAVEVEPVVEPAAREVDMSRPIGEVSVDDPVQDIADELVRLQSRGEIALESFRSGIPRTEGMPLFDALEIYMGIEADASIAESPEAKRAFDVLADLPLSEPTDLYRSMNVKPSELEPGSVVRIGRSWSKSKEAAAYYASSGTNRPEVVLKIEGATKGADISALDLDQYNQEVLTSGVVEIVGEPSVETLSPASTDGQGNPSPARDITVVRVRALPPGRETVSVLRADERAAIMRQAVGLWSSEQLAERMALAAEARRRIQDGALGQPRYYDNNTFTPPNYEPEEDPVFASASDPVAWRRARVPLNEIYTTQSHVFDTAENPITGRLFARELPELVQQADGRFHIEDGNHRIALAHVLGQTEVDAMVYVGPGHSAWTNDPRYADPEPDLAFVREVTVDDRDMPFVARPRAYAMAAQAFDQRGLRAKEVAPGRFRVSAEDQAALNAGIALARQGLETTALRIPGVTNLEGIAIEIAEQPEAPAAEIEESGAEWFARLQRIYQTTEQREVASRVDQTDQQKRFMPQPVSPPPDNPVPDSAPKAVPEAGMHGGRPTGPNGEYMFADGRQARVPDEPLRIAHLLGFLERAYGLGIYKGKTKAKYLGFQRKGLGEIRLAKLTDYETFAHEFGHWFDDRFMWVGRLYNRYQRAGGVIMPGADNAVEGYAEFMRLWLTSEHDAIAADPNFHQLWREELAKHPEDQRILLAAQELFHAYGIQGERARALGKIGPTPQTFFTRVREMMPDGLKQRVFDGLYAVRRMELDLFGNDVLGIYKRMRLAYGGLNSMVEGIFFYGTPQKRADNEGFTYSGDGLRQVFGKYWGNRDLANYMIGKRAQELLEQGRERLFSEQEAASLVAIGETNPELETIRLRYVQFNDRMLAFARDMGLFSEEQIAEMREANLNYVPFYRVFDDMLRGVEGAQRGSVSKAGSPFRRLRGGESAVNDVFENILTNVYVMTRAAVQNDAKRAVFEAIGGSDSALGAGFAAPAEGRSELRIDQRDLYERLLAEEGIDASTRQKVEAGLGTPQEESILAATRRRLNPIATLGDVYIGAQAPPSDGSKPLEYYLRDGERVWFEVNDPQLYESLLFLKPKTVGFFLGLMSGFAKVLRRGVTSLPGFAARNFVRDSVQAWVIGRGRMPFWNALEGMGAQLDTDRNGVYADMLINGGGFATRLEGMDDPAMFQGSRLLRGAGMVVDNGRKLVRFYDKVLGSAENANRVGEFIKARRDGASPMAAAFDSRDISTDFALRGSAEVMRVIAMSIPFFNAQLQAYRVLAARGFGPEYQTSIAMKGAMLATFSVMLAAINSDDEDIEQLPEETKDRFWIFRVGQREDDLVFFPKPYDFGFVFGSAPERAFRLAAGQDDLKTTMRGIWWMAAHSALSLNAPAIAKPWVDLGFNTNYAGDPIVPGYLDSVDANQQWTFYTSETMRASAQGWNRMAESAEDRIGVKPLPSVSPIQGEYLVRGYLGTLGTYALTMTDAMINATFEREYGEPVAPADYAILSELTGRFYRSGPPSRTRHVQELYRMHREAKKVADTIALLRRRRDHDEIERMLARPTVVQRLSQEVPLRRVVGQFRGIRVAMDNIRMDPQMPGLEKRNRIYELVRQRNAIARQVRQALTGVGEASEPPRPPQQDAAGIAPPTALPAVP